MYAGQLPPNPQASNSAANAGPAISPVNHHWEFAYRTAERFGIPVVILSAVLWWARNDMIQPLLDAHFNFIHKISDAHEKQVEKLGEIGEKLDTLIRVQEKR